VESVPQWSQYCVDCGVALVRQWSGVGAAVESVRQWIGVSAAVACIVVSVRQWS
jgi:hypothetical protein